MFLSCKNCPSDWLILLISKKTINNKLEVIYFISLWQSGPVLNRKQRVSCKLFGQFIRFSWLVQINDKISWYFKSFGYIYHLWL